MKNRFLLTAVMLLFACIAAKGQAQKLIAMKDAGTLKYKGATYHINIENTGKDAKGNTTVEIASNDLKVPVSSNSMEQVIASVSKYTMVKIVAGDQTYSAKNIAIKKGSVNNGVGDSQWAEPRNVVFSFETTATPDRIIVYNDDVESISFDMLKTAGSQAVSVQTKVTNQVTFEKNAYTVSIGSVSNDQHGNITAEILSAEVINLPLKNGTVTLPMTAKMVASGKTISSEEQVSVARNSLTFKFKSAEAPDKIIVYGNDGNDNTGVTFNITKDMVKTVQAAQPAQVASQAQPTTQQPAQQYQTYQQPTTHAQPATQQYQQYQQPTAQKQQASATVINTPQKQIDEFKKWYVESGLSIYVLTDDYDSYVFAGFIINGGLYTSPNSRFSLDLSFNIYSEDAGTFTYTKSGSSKVHTDGKITHDYWAIPIQFTWNYIFDLGPVFKLRLGPSAGFTSLSESYTYSPQIDNAPKIDTESAVMLSVGGGLGATWNIKKCFIDTGYKFLWNSENDITDTTIAHQITITFGWRF